MTFEEYWENVRESNFGDSEGARRDYAKSAWDAAICAVQEQMFIRGKLRDAGEIADAASALHTWEKPAN